MEEKLDSEENNLDVMLDKIKKLDEQIQIGRKNKIPQDKLDSLLEKWKASSVEYQKEVLSRSCFKPND